MTATPELLTARALSNHYRTKKLSPVEVTEACLAVARAHNEHLRAFVGLDGESALDAARAAEARWRIGRRGRDLGDRFRSATRSLRGRSRRAGKLMDIE